MIPALLTYSFTVSANAATLSGHSFVELKSWTKSGIIEAGTGLANTLAKANGDGTLIILNIIRLEAEAKPVAKKPAAKKTGPRK